MEVTDQTSKQVKGFHFQQVDILPIPTISYLTRSGKGINRISNLQMMVKSKGTNIGWACPKPANKHQKENKCELNGKFL